MVTSPNTVGGAQLHAKLLASKCGGHDNDYVGFYVALIGCGPPSNFGIAMVANLIGPDGVYTKPGATHAWGNSFPLKPGETFCAQAGLPLCLTLNETG